MDRRSAQPSPSGYFFFDTGASPEEARGLAALDVTTGTKGEDGEPSALIIQVSIPRYPAGQH